MAAAASVGVNKGFLNKGVVCLQWPRPPSFCKLSPAHLGSANLFGKLLANRFSCVDNKKPLVKQIETTGSYILLPNLITKIYNT